MQLSIALILCFGIALINALPEQRTLTKTFQNDGSLESLFNAIRYGSVRGVQEMIAKRDVNAEDDQGVTALHVAAIKGDNEMATLLIEHGADVNKKNANKVTALHVAANNGNEKFARELIKSGADPNALDKNGVSQIQLAVFGNDRRMVNLLIKNGADLNHADYDGKTVLHWAAAKANEIVAQLLIENGATKVSVPDKVGKTPLYYATLTGNLAFADVLKNFLASGGGVSSCSSFGLLLFMIIYSMII